MSSNLRVDRILPSTGTEVGVGTATGSVALYGDVNVAGTLTYEDVTSVDSVGLSTFQNGIHVTGGSVGIGTDSPAAGNKLHLHDTSACRIQLTTDSTGHTLSDGTRLMVDSSNNFEILNRENSNIEFFTNNTERLRIRSDGKLMTQSAGYVYTASSAGSLSLYGGNTNLGGGIVLSGGNTNGDIRFYAQMSTATPAERMCITSDGQIGMGIASPTQESGIGLHIRGANGGQSRIHLTNSDTGDTATDGFYIISQGAESGGASGEVMLQQKENKSLKFATNNTERLRIDPDGKLILSGTARTTPFIVGDGGMCIEQSYDGLLKALSLRNKDTDAAAATALSFSLNRSGGDQDFEAGEIKLVKEQAWTTSSSTVDGSMIFSTIGNGSLGERLRITSGGNIGINCNDPGSMLELNAAAGTKMGISLGAVGDSITASRYIGICKSADQTDLGANSGFSGIEFGGPYSTDEGYLAFHTHDLGVESGERIRLTKDGKFGVGLTAPESKVQIRNTTTHGKDTYATANTGGSQTPPTGTFKWDNVTPVAGHGRGYEAWVQSGDAYPNASNYIDVLIRNAAFYRITLKRSHSSAEASVCQMMIYGLANSSNSNYPVVHMTGASGSGTSTATVQTGNGRGSSNAVASFYWEIHSYNVNTHDSIIRIHTTGSNNQGIVALIEQI